MRFPRLSTSEVGIGTRLLFWFLVISLVPCGLIAGLIEYMTSSALEKTVRRGLMVVSEAKASSIDQYVGERRGDVALAGHLPFVIEATTKLGDLLKTQAMDSPAYAEASEPYKRVLKFYRDSYGYNNVLLFDVDGKLLLRMSDGLNIGSTSKKGRSRIRSWPTFSSGRKCCSNRFSAISRRTPV